MENEETQSHSETVDRIKSQRWGNDCIYDFALTDEGIRRGDRVTPS